MKLSTILLVIFVVVGSVVPSVSAQDGPIKNDPRDIVYKQVITEDELLTFAYPENWYLDESAIDFNGIGILSEESLLEADPTEPLKSGEVTMLIRLFDTEDMAEQGVEGETLEERLTSYMDLLSEVTDDEGNAVYEFGEISYHDRHPLVIPYTQVVYTINGFEATLLFWDVADGLTGVALVRTAERQWLLYENVVTTVALSMQYLGDEYDPIQLPDEEETEGAQ